jgi:hypothetical protein
MFSKKFLVMLVIVCIVAYVVGATSEAKAQDQGEQYVESIREAVLPYGVADEWHLRIMVSDYPVGLYTLMSLCQNDGGYWYWLPQGFWKWNYCSWPGEVVNQDGQ